MSGLFANTTIAPHFWRTPFKYCRWAAHHKPSIFYSIIMGVTGPVLLITVPIYRRHYNIELPPEIPMTYPVPTGQRKIPEGYDDPA